MTRERGLKKIIRARAAKTGERYTTARRHVLAAKTRLEPDSPARSAIKGPSRSPVSDVKILETIATAMDGRCRPGSRSGIGLRR
jgi:hypothetical protein